MKLNQRRQQSLGGSTSKSDDKPCETVSFQMAFEAINSLSAGISVH